MTRKLYEWLHRKWPGWLDCRPILARRAVEDVGFHIVEATELSLWGLPVEIVLATKT